MNWTFSTTTVQQDGKFHPKITLTYPSGIKRTIWVSILGEELEEVAHNQAVHKLRQLVPEITD